MLSIISSAFGRTAVLVSIAVAACAGVACSSSSTTGSGGTGEGSGTGTGEGSGTGGACDTLTVNNFESWCSVAVNGEAASTSAKQTVCVASGTKVSLVAKPAPNFILGSAPWVSGTTGQGTETGGTGSGGTSTNSVTVTGATCVAVCCPFPSGSGCTGITTGC
jgi:hypothetical protein